MADFLSWEELPITNNFMFQKVMQDKELCKGLLETILKIEVDHLGEPVIDNYLSEDPESKFVKFDVYVKNSNRSFIIEMQIVNTKELPLRARFYQAISDISELKPGRKYLRLRENIVIFLCPFDLYKCGLPFYTFENRSIENPKIKLGDKTRKIFINFNFYAKIEDEKTRQLMKFFSEGEAEGELPDKFFTALKHARRNLAWKGEWMKLNFAMADLKQLSREEGLAEGRAEGRAEGIAQGRAEGIAEKEAELRPIIDKQTEEISRQAEEIIIYQKLLAEHGISVPEKM